MLRELSEAELLDLKEEMRREELTFLRRLIRSSPGNLFWKNKEGYFLGANLNSAKLSGFSDPGDIIGKRNEDLYGCYGKTITELDKEVYRSGNKQGTTVIESVLLFYNDGVLDEAVSLEEVESRKDQYPSKLHHFGVRRHFLTKKNLILDEDDNPIGLVGAAYEITEMKEREAELVQEKARFEKIISKRTEFISNMRHDLRTPCAGILGLARLLLEKETDPVKQKELQFIVESSKNLLSLLSQILDVTLVQEDGLPFRSETMHLEAMLKDLKGLLTAELSRKNMRLVVDLDPNIPEYFNSDRMRLHRILLNLLTNAIKFSPEYTIVNLHIAGKELSKDYWELQFAVKDEGPGISDKNFGLIFERFSRLEGAGVSSGTGAGLSIVETFVDDMGGYICLDSELGKGSCFTCVFQMQSIQKDVNEVFKDPSLEARSTIEFPGVQALFIEDDEVARYMANSVLKRLGCDVKFAKDRTQALDLVHSSERFDVIFIDVGLPNDVNGFDLAQEIKFSDCPNAAASIVMMTAHAEQETFMLRTKEKRTYRLQPLVKPLSMETLRRVLMQAFSQE